MKKSQVLNEIHFWGFTVLSVLGVMIFVVALCLYPTSSDDPSLKLDYIKYLGLGIGNMLMGCIFGLIWIHDDKEKQ